MIFQEEKLKQVPEEFKQLAKDFAEKGFITTSTIILLIGRGLAHFIG